MKGVSSYDDVKSLFCENRIEDGLMVLLDLATRLKDNYIENDIILLIADYKEIRRQESLHLLSSDDYFKQRNRIIRSSLDMNENLHKSYSIKENHLKRVTTREPQKGFLQVIRGLFI
jgi:Effector-associated domain 11